MKKNTNFLIPPNHRVYGGVTSAIVRPSHPESGKTHRQNGRAAKQEFRPVTTEGSEAKQAVSAGGVVLRRVESGIEIVLCYRRSENLWALPKGTPEAGESIEETALREVTEETGFEVKIGPPAGETRYSFDRNGYRYDKVVYFYLMSADGGDPGLHDEEFDLVEWVPLDQVAGRLTFENESRIVEKALSLAEEHDGR
ncbi:MAG: NUDIX hydrolase [Chloroflexi bacterium]|nr:NUDIX hydrolase [Chloroflexota bacterium]